MTVSIVYFRLSQLTMMVQHQSKLLSRIAEKHGIKVEEEDLILGKTPSGRTSVYKLS